MNKYSVISSGTKKSENLLKKFNSMLDKSKWELDNEDFKYLFIFGGDGSLLRIINKYINKKIRIIVINGGTFGFFSSFTSKNIDYLFHEIDNDKNYVNPLMLKVSSNSKKWYALNEVVISSSHLIKLDIDINNYKYELFKGTGLLFTTAWGSTGRNRSAGGSVIFPSNDVYGMVELEAVNQKKYNTLNSPIIVHRKTKFSISVKSYIDSIDLLYDGNKDKFNENINLKIEAIIPKFKLFYPTSTKEYINKLQNKFITTE